MAVLFANAGSDAELLIAGFIMVFFIQVAGLPTNARASGFGWAAGVGRLATAGIFPAIPWVKNGFGLTAVFFALAIVLLIAAVSVVFLGSSRWRGRDASCLCQCRRPVRRCDAGS